MRRTRLASLIVLTVAAGLLSSACTQAIWFASISANGKVVPSADGAARPAATSASAAAAVQAKTIKIDPTTTSITLVAGQTVELDLTGTWMATFNAKQQLDWVCPEIVSAGFYSNGWSTSAWNVSAKEFAELFGQFGVPFAASKNAVVMGPTCSSAFAGRKVTVTAPEICYPNGSKPCALLVSIASGALDSETRKFVVGQSVVVDVNVTPAASTNPTPAPAPRATGLYFTLNPGATADRSSIARATLDGATVNPAFVNAGANATSVAVRGDYLYWSTDTAIGRAKLDGTSVQPAFISGLSDVKDIAVTDQYIFWIRNGSSSAGIGRADISGTNANGMWFPSPTDPTFPALEYIAANASHVYFATVSFGGAGGPSNFIRRVSVTNPADVTNLPGGVGATQGYFAVDDAYLYASGAYPNSGGMGAGIGRMALSTATSVGLSELVYKFPDGYTAERGVAADGTHLYWVSRHDSSSTYFLSRANVDGTGADVTWLPLSIVPNSLAVSSATTRRGTAGGGGRAGGASQPGSTVRTTGYAAKTSFRLADGALLQAGKSSKTNGPLAGSVFGGTYRWSTPARGNGKTRPGALVAFARGAYAAEAPQLGVLGGASSQVGVGRAYMLLRGASAKDLLCLELASNLFDQSARIVGGRGAGAGLRGTVTGVQFQVPFEAIGVVTTGTGSARTTALGQVKPFTTAGTLAASTGKDRGLPGACRALTSRLSAPSPTPAPMPVPVTG